jgi:hypothetical protein
VHHPLHTALLLLLVLLLLLLLLLLLVLVPQDVMALLDLRALMLGSSPSPNLTAEGSPDLTEWVPGGQPCSNPTCQPCGPTAAPCNSPSPQGQTCHWPYVACKDGRVNRVVLGEAHRHLIHTCHAHHLCW